MREAGDREHGRARQGRDNRSARLREQTTYLGEGSSTRPWLRLGTKPRGMGPPGSQRLRPTEARARATRVSTEAQTGATPAFSTHFTNTDNSAGFRIPRARPPMPGIGTLRDCVTERLPELQETPPHPRAAGRRCVSTKRQSRGGPTGCAWSLFLSTAWPPLAPRHSSRDARRVGVGVGEPTTVDALCAGLGAIYKV